MIEQRASYQGVDILVRAPRVPMAEAIARRARQEEHELPELQIGGESVAIYRTAGGAYIASGFAYAPEPSVMGLAKRLIDHRARSRAGRKP